jgi:importin subunit beta-1
LNKNQQEAMTFPCGRAFSRYLEGFFPYLELGLQQHRELQACQVAVGCLGDVCRACEEQVEPYCDRIVSVLLTNLQSDEVHRAIKPQILSVFGDMAMSLGDRFEKYLPHVVPMLQAAAVMSVEQQRRPGSAEDRDYNNQLRQGVLEAWAGLLNGLTKDKADAFLRHNAPSLIEFVEAVASDAENQDSSVWHKSAALLGDVAGSLSGVGPLFHQKPFVQKFLGQCAMDPATEDTARWAWASVQKSMQESATHM